MSVGVPPRGLHAGGVSFHEATASYLSRMGGTSSLQYHDPRSGYDAQQDLPRNFHHRFDGLYQPQAQTGFPPSQAQFDLEARLKPSGSGSGSPANAHGPLRSQHASNNPSPYGSHGQNEQSPNLVSVEWSFGREITNENLDFNAPVQHFQDRLDEVLAESFDIDPGLNLYKLKFSSENNKFGSLIVKFKNKTLADVWGNIVKWMQKNNPGGGEPLQCKIDLVDKVASET
jgi:hypothetical protein